MKRFLSMGLIIVLSLVVVSQNVEANDFEERSSHYRSICSTNYKENKAVCEEYREWLNAQLENSQNEMDNLKVQLEQNKATIAINTDLLNQYSREVEIAQSEIDALSVSIGIKENEIIALEGKITEKEDSIEEREETVKNYLVISQESMHVNDYIEFVMGAQDFSEMVRRSEGLNRIKEFNEEVIEELNQERKELVVMQEDLMVIKDQLVEDRAYQEQKKEYARSQEEVYTLMVSKIRAENQAIAREMEMVEEKADISEELMRSIGDSVVASSDFGVPVGGHFEITATVWYYPASWGGAPHFGTDFLVDLGSPLLSPGNGMVVATRGGCSTSGSWGCNGGWGNYLTLIINVNGTIYGVMMAHLTNNSFMVSPQDIVSRGSVLAKTGHSGNSTAPHLHLELYYLGDDSVQDAYMRWNNGGNSNTFNTGSSSSGDGWSKRCVANGGVAPCRMDPLSVFPYQLGGSYN